MIVQSENECDIWVGLGQSVNQFASCCPIFMYSLTRTIQLEKRLHEVGQYSEQMTNVQPTTEQK